MKVNIGFKMSKRHFLNEWPEGVKESFDSDTWLIIETKSFGSDYKIFLRKPFELSEARSWELQELLEILAGTSGIEPIMKLAEEMPEEWELLTDAKTN